jgi:fluoroquinolone resistance protein
LVIELHKTLFREVQFNQCKMLGLRFSDCNAFGLSLAFDGCQLNHSSFYKTNITNTLFKNTQLHEVDFVETGLLINFGTRSLQYKRIFNKIYKKNLFNP